MRHSVCVLGPLNDEASSEAEDCGQCYPAALMDEMFSTLFMISIESNDWVEC